MEGETMSGDGGRGDATFRYTARTLDTTHETRHEAIGALACYGDWESDSVAPISESCLVRRWGTTFVGPDHIGDKYFDERQYMATTHGVAQIDQVSLVRRVNNHTEKVVNSWWEIECPVCGFTHEIDGSSEDARREAIDVMLDCCDIEWQPPSDWIEDCEICGDSHRERHDCTCLSHREPFPSPDSHRYDCAECQWTGDGDDLHGPAGFCPDCGTSAVRAVQVATDGGTKTTPPGDDPGMAVMGYEPVAAAQYDGDRECQYDCENEADFVVEWSAPQYTGGKTSLVCETCSRMETVHVVGNNLTRHELSWRAIGALPERIVDALDRGRELPDACPSCGYAMVSNDDWWDETPQGRPSCPDCGAIPDGFDLNRDNRVSPP
jgi:uncharacterized OB-fold protein